jgi:hypothetical protein
MWLQVAAFTAGRTAVNEYDALLMRHVLWSRPEDQDAIYDWLLGRLAVSGDLKQSNYLLASLFGRTCHALDVRFFPYHFIANKCQMLEHLEFSETTLTSHHALSLTPTSSGPPLVKSGYPI